MVSMHLLTAAAQGEQTKSIAARFREAGATEPGTAMAWSPAGKADETSQKAMIEKGALVEVRPGTWYLNEEKLAASGGGQGVLVVVMLALAALMGGMLLLLLAR